MESAIVVAPLVAAAYHVTGVLMSYLLSTIAPNGPLAQQ